MEVMLRGVRGGIAAPTPDTSFYGGNTACIEVRTGNGLLLFLDAGTGLREAGMHLPDSGETHVFISHGHADHIIGLWFFKPIHSPNWTTHLYLPDWLDPLPDWFYQCGLFPVPLEQLQGKIVRHRIKAGETLSLGPETENSASVRIETFAVHHPGGGLGYRVQADNAVLVYTGDHEITAEARDIAAHMVHGADLAVVDAQYSREDYRPGFGHSTWEDWMDVAGQAEVRQLVISHHDPARPDSALHNLDNTLRGFQESGYVRALVAREGLCFTPGKDSAKLNPKHHTHDDVRPARRESDRLLLFMEELSAYRNTSAILDNILAKAKKFTHDAVAVRLARRESDRLLQFMEELSAYRDTSAILDRILAKAREITHADAGTIFLTEGDELVFAYTHNDSLFSAGEAHKHAYTAIRLPISEESIAGYVATTGKLLNLADVRSLPIGVPYAFNDAFDRKTGFVTKSMLTLPFLDGKGKTLGVLQLINSLNPLDKTPRPFSMNMEQDCRMLAHEVSGILERNEVEKRGIYGILRMAAVHDPAETGPHAERVGAIVAELYHAWALHHGHSLDSIRYEKGLLRLASMLHDIGKVGVSDNILKKPGKLTDEEFAVIRGHTALGASILAKDTGEIGPLASDIALHHHQKWNGKGYAGSGEEGKLAGEDIPLGARITAIADVFDALVSPRCYKQPWTFEEALNILRKDAGEHFDPSLVDSMAEIEELLHHIYTAFPDKK